MEKSLADLLGIAVGQCRAAVLEDVGAQALDAIPCQTCLPFRDPETSARLMKILDAVTGRFGRGTLRPAVTGFERPWKAKAEFLSSRYTTHIDELLRVRAV